MYGEILPFRYSISNGNVKYQIGKSIFAQNLALQLSPATVANVDIGSLKSLHTLFNKYLDHMLVNLNKIVWSKLHEILNFLTKIQVF